VKSSPRLLLVVRYVCVAVLALSFSGLAYPQNSPTRLVTQAIDERRLVTLQGTVHPLVQAAYDQGPLPDSFAAKRMLLILNRPPEREAGLQQFLKSVHEAGNAGYHQWVTPEQFGQQFGPADSDVQIAESWLVARLQRGGNQQEQAVH
jgi:subtilase family serine protease